MSAEHRSLLDIACVAAREAGAAILEVYRQDFAVRHKADQSPVTRADERAEAIIAQRLAAAMPSIPVIAEEHCAAHGLPATAPPRFWLVDPLDGTKEFIRRNGEFTVNIALVEGDRAVLGVVHVPSQDVTYAAADRATRQRGDGAPQPIVARPVPPRGAVVVHSRSHADEKQLAAYVATLADAERRLAGSALKFCLLAAGEADLYPRFGPTAEWDTAAGQVVLEAAGGTVTTLDGARLRYGKPGFCNPDFIARGPASPKG
jgi:3'(2'), 5'-bisphosphate nucleotidase